MNYNKQRNEAVPEVTGNSNLSSYRLHTSSKKNLKIESYLSDAMKTSKMADENKKQGIEPSVKSPGLLF